MGEPQAVMTARLMVVDPSSPEPRLAPQSAVDAPVVSPMPPVSSTGLTLDQAISQCLMNDPKIRAGLEAVRQSHADAVTASLPPNPSVAVAAGLLPLSRPYTVDEPGGPTEFDVGASYSLDWFLFGKRAAAMASATMGICVSEAEYADLVRHRVTETSLAFYDLLEARALLEVASLDLDNLERVETVTRKAVENGGRPQVELSRIRLELLNAKRAKRDAHAALVAAQAKLRALLGLDATGSPLEVAGTLDGPMTAQPLDVEDAFTVAQQNRPDLLSMRRKIARAESDLVVECRNAYPEVTSDFGIGHQFQQSIGAPDVTTWGTGLEVSIPLFNRNQGNRAKAASAIRQSNHELHAGVLELRAEIEESVAMLRTAQQNATSVAHEELQLAAQVTESINKAYEAGGRPLLDVLDAQRNYREIYRTFVTTRAEYWRALSKYQSALGQQVAP